MAIAVNIFVKDTQPSPQPIEGVVVNVYDPVTLLLVAAGTSDSSGLVTLLLDGTDIGTMYELRSFKSTVLFDNPKRIEVVDPLGSGQTNDFDISGTLTTLPVATDPSMCRCTGQFVDFSGRPIVGATVRILQIMESGFQSPKVLNSNMVSASSMTLQTDTNGKVSLDLIRKGQFNVSFSGEDEVVWNIIVPDRSSVNLIDLIHPQPVLFVWDSSDAPSNAVSVALEESKQIHFTVTFSDYEVLSKNLSKYLEFTNSDGTKAEVIYSDGEGIVTVRGVASGSCSVTVALKPEIRPFRIPDYSLTSSALAVTVT